MYREVTKGIEVEAEPFYVAERSNPKNSLFFFAYRIRITNVGASPAQLLRRHWIITDGHGATEHVRGPGVVGETPRLEPGASFEYTSFCPLQTPTGNMRGSYEMVSDAGDPFEVKIPLFFLREPGSFH